MNEQANSPKVWKDDSPFGDEVVVDDLSESDLMVVIAMRGNYSFVLLRGTLGYINNLCVQHAFIFKK